MWTIQAAAVLNPKDSPRPATHLSDLQPLVVAVPLTTLANWLSPVACQTNMQVRTGESPEEATVMFSYTVYDKRTPMLDENNNPVRKVRWTVAG